MKYLIFNAAVVGALAYIFLGGGDVNIKEITEPVSSAIEQVVKAEPAKAKPARKTAPVRIEAIAEELSAEEKFILYGEKATTKSVEKTPAKAPEEPVKPAPKTKVAAVDVPPLPAAIEVAAKAVKLPRTQSEPVHQRRDTETQVTTASAGIAPPAPVDQLERRKNLRRLVADMERVFAEKLTQ